MTQEEFDRRVREFAEVLGATIVETKKVPHKHEPKKCASCGAPIFWARTEAGKSRPVDAKPTGDGTLRLVDRGGTIICTEIRDEARARYPGQLRTPHARTCSKREEWGRGQAGVGGGGEEGQGPAVDGDGGGGGSGLGG